MRLVRALGAAALAAPAVEGAVAERLAKLPLADDGVCHVRQPCRLHAHLALRWLPCQTLLPELALRDAEGDNQAPRASPRAIQSAPSSSAPAGGEVDEVASVSTD